MKHTITVAFTSRKNT